MAYPDDQLKRPDPYASQLRGDPQPLDKARGAGSRMTGILVAVILVLGLIFAVSLFSGGGDPEIASAATPDTTVPGDGAVAPATGAADDTAPVAPTAPAD